MKILHITNRLVTATLAAIMLIGQCSVSVLASSTNAASADEAIASDSDSESDFDGYATAPDIVSDSAIVMDAYTGQILYAKDAFSTRYPASITKIMTGLIALENGDLNSTVTFSEDAIWGIERDSTHIALDVGEQLTLEQALYATLVVSANEAAWGVAEHIAGSLSSFCDMMNAKAAELGCTNTHFVNANGLHSDDHYTCAYDIALIAREAIKNAKFVEITSTTYYEIPPTNLQPETRYLYQDNKLIKENSDYYYPYCIGGKTGYTDQAGGTLVSWAKKGDRTLICVTLHASPARNTYTDSIALFDYCFDNFSYQRPFTAFKFSEEDIAAAEGFLNDYYNGHNAGKLTLAADIKGIGMYAKSDPASLTTKLNFATDNIEENILGSVSIMIDDYEVMSVPLFFWGYEYISNEPPTIEVIAPDFNSGHESSDFPWWIATAIILLLAVTIISIRRIYILTHKK